MERSSRRPQLAVQRPSNLNAISLPVNLETDSACTHCGAPVALIDPEGVAKALQEISTGAYTGGSADPEATRTALSDAQISAIFDLERMRQRDSDDDLVAIGAAAIGALLAGWLGSR